MKIIFLSVLLTIAATPTLAACKARQSLEKYQQYKLKAGYKTAEACCTHCEKQESCKAIAYNAVTQQCGLLKYGGDGADGCETTGNWQCYIAHKEESLDGPTKVMDDSSVELNRARFNLSVLTTSMLGQITDNLNDMLRYLNDFDETSPSEVDWIAAVSDAATQFEVVSKALLSGMGSKKSVIELTLSSEDDKTALDLAYARGKETISTAIENARDEILQLRSTDDDEAQLGGLFSKIAKVTSAAIKFTANNIVPVVDKLLDVTEETITAEGCIESCVTELKSVN